MEDDTPTELVVRKVKYFGVQPFCGIGYKSVESFNGRKRWYVLSPDGVWYTTNNRDWEPEHEVPAHIKMEIVN